MLCAFLKEICRDSELGEDFNEFRIIRNKINYYGKNVEVNEAERLVIEMINLRMKLIKRYIEND